MALRNLVNLESVQIDFGKGPVLDDMSLGVLEGQRVGIVGRNGGGKSTLMRVLAGAEPPHKGRRSIAADTRIGWLNQQDDFAPGETARGFIFGDQLEHEWAAVPRYREIVTALLGGTQSAELEKPLAEMSGGQRRRVSLAKHLVSDINLLLLDEPTNHLDVEGVAWLAQHLKQRTDLAVAVITHDRWFLDEISDITWEVVDAEVMEYDGGYSAFVLSKAERMRQASSAESRRNNLLRKELAWLRRGAPARTSKPKFRIDAANELIANEPPPRNETQLLAFANSRLGKSVIDFTDADISVGPEPLITHLNWILGPGDRVAIVGINGSGKSTLMRTIVGELRPTAGSLKIGTTVKLAYLSQHLEELDPTWRLIEAVERIALRVQLGDGRELSAATLCERLGFPAEAQWTPVGDLSGGERRRLQLTRLLMGEPNVLILDEPTNDFDVETLAALEDLLDSFGGTLLVISHDRYFLERVCDRFVGLMGDKQLRDLPRGVDEYLVHRIEELNQVANAPVKTKTISDAAATRNAKKDMNRIDRQLSKLNDAEKRLHEKMALVVDDFELLSELSLKQKELIRDRADLEAQWLQACEIAGE
jgi:ABC transport system ATP-binding/permease protein